MRSVGSERAQTRGQLIAQVERHRAAANEVAIGLKHIHRYLRNGDYDASGLYAGCFESDLRKAAELSIEVDHALWHFMAEREQWAKQWAKEDKEADDEKE